MCAYVCKSVCTTYSADTRIKCQHDHNYRITTTGVVTETIRLLIAINTVCLMHI